MKKLYSILLAFIFVSGALAQDVSVSVELVYSDDGTVAGYPEGYSTWRVYALLQNDDDFLSAVYAVAEEPAIEITTSTDHIWNAALGGVTATEVYEALYSNFPSLQYDSWVTIGADSNESNSDYEVDQIASSPSANVIADAFSSTSSTEDEVDGNLSVIDGLWYHLNPDADGVATGDDNRVLIAQVTTDGDISVCMNFQVFLHGMVGDMVDYSNYCQTQLNPLNVEETRDGAKVSYTILPNPSSGIARLTAVNGKLPYQVIVRDMMGKVVDAINSNGMETLTMNVTAYEAGMYFVQPVDQNGTVLQTMRWIIQ
jgi:hypothetical protein